MTAKTRQADHPVRHAKAIDLDESERQGPGRRPPPKVTLPRVHFLERPLPEWWDDEPPPLCRKGR
jgi:hypothetical protein